MKTITDVLVLGKKVTFGRTRPHGKGTFVSGRYVATEASLTRVHKVVSEMVNNGKAIIAVFDGGYEIEA